MKKVLNLVAVLALIMGLSAPVLLVAQNGVGKRDTFSYSPVEKQAITLRIENRPIPMSYKTEGWVTDSTLFHFSDEVSFQVVKIPKSARNNSGVYAEEAYPNSVHLFGVSSPLSWSKPQSGSEGKKIEGFVLEYKGVHFPFRVAEVLYQKTLGDKPEKVGIYVLDYTVDKKTGQYLVKDPVSDVTYAALFQGGDASGNLPILATVMITVAGTIVPK